MLRKILSLSCSSVLARALKSTLKKSKKVLKIKIKKLNIIAYP
ncbi:hypothetical protein V6N98_000443 [Campylobacter upsaliensis]